VRIMIVGADDLGLIEERLRECGVTEICHVSGRNCSHRKVCPIAQSVQLVLILTDYINHVTARNFKKAAKSRGIPIVCAKRSWCAIEEKITSLGINLGARSVPSNVRAEA
jgi:hypothetical protein